jgi:hypothetical protein
MFTIAFAYMCSAFGLSDPYIIGPAVISLGMFCLGILIYTHKSAHGFDMVGASIIAAGSTIAGAVYAIFALKWSPVIFKLALGLVSGLMIEVYIIQHTCLLMGVEAEQYRLQDYLPAVISFFAGVVVLVIQVLEIAAILFENPIIN